MVIVEIPAATDFTVKGGCDVCNKLTRLSGEGQTDVECVRRYIDGVMPTSCKRLSRSTRAAKCG
jgi:hypothetical protein